MEEQYSAFFMIFAVYSVVPMGLAETLIGGYFGNPDYWTALFICTLITDAIFVLVFFILWLHRRLFNLKDDEPIFLFLIPLIAYSALPMALAGLILESYFKKSATHRMALYFFTLIFDAIFVLIFFLIWLHRRLLSTLFGGLKTENDNDITINQSGNEGITIDPKKS